jgi:Cu-Zn family superoxide dismutase
MRAAPALLVLGFIALACARDDGAGAADTGTVATPGASPAGSAGTSDTMQAARAMMRNASGREIGTVSIRETAAGLGLSGTLNGLPPGAHAIHIHMVGRCEPPFDSAGDHWNPTNRQHGTENPQGPHLGDLPNLTVAADSTGSVQGTTPGGTLRGTNSLLDGDGAAVIVHTQPDDYRTDPSGNSGDRIACGVISGS